MNKFQKLSSKIIFSTISIFLVVLLVTQVDITQIKSSINILVTGNSLILYISLAITSLIARSERFFLLHSINNQKSNISLRLLILAGTALRNVSMNFIPLRIGELSVPSLIKLIDSREKFSNALNPIWISIIFDMAALFILGLTLFIGMELGLESPLTHSSLKLGLFENIILFFIALSLILLLLNFTNLIVKFFDLNFIKHMKIKFFKFTFQPADFSKSIPILKSALVFRILLLSLTIRIAKYLSLTNLFFALSASLEPSLANIFPIFIAFVSAEIFSSLPGSGIMGFGGYELSFQWVLKILVPHVICPLSLITSIHLTGFVVEILIALIVVPTSIILSKLLSKKS